MPTSRSRTPSPSPDTLGSGPSEHSVTSDAALLEQALFEVKKVIVGHDGVLERVLTCLLARGHCLVEGPPGLAKTLAVSTLAEVSGGSFVRLQFTPDLVPSDIVGTRIWKASTETFDIALGPVFANFVLADEVNRAPAKVQSALLEVMAERQVSIGGHTHPLPEPFVVMATQNPIESEGVYPLPEAQRDRFMMKVLFDYPSRQEETTIVDRMAVNPPHATAVLSPTELVRLQRVADAIFVHPAIVDYAVRLVQATRDPAAAGLPHLGSHIAYGASPRASLALVTAARALALLRGRTYALPEDVADFYPDIVRHRLVLSYEALAEDVDTDALLAEICQRVEPPRLAPRHDHAGQPIAPMTTASPADQDSAAG